MQVIDSEGVEYGCQGLSIELGVVARTWNAANINDPLYAFRPENVYKLFQRTSPVANGFDKMPADRIT